MIEPIRLQVESMAEASTKKEGDGRLRTTASISMSSPDITEAERAAVLSVLESQELSMGPRLTAFEKAICEAVGAPYAAAVNSGTSGLHLCIQAAGIGEGDLVLTSPFSFVASANCILYERANPIFVDVDSLTGNLDPQLAVEAIDSIMNGRPGGERWLPPSLRSAGQCPDPSRLKALLPVHAFGQPADMDPLLEVARHYGLMIIEDTCEAIGAEYQGRKAGTLADMGVFAFYPNKQMTTGEGGVIVTANEQRLNLIRSLRNQGRDEFNAWLHHVRLGYNYRMDEMSAALGLVQVQRLNELIQKRAQVANWYNQRLADAPSIENMHISEKTTRMSWFVYIVRIHPPLNRNRIMEELAAIGIPSRPYFTPIHLQPFYRTQFGYEEGDFLVTEHLGDISLALPFSSVMTEKQVNFVCDHLLQFVGKS